MTLTIYGDRLSGNCLKVLWTAEYLGVPYEWIDVDILEGESRSESFLRMNPAGQVPVVVFDDGRALAQSNAILLHLAEGSALLPQEPFARAKLLEWLFWEQYSHEPAIAVARFQVRYLGKAVSDLDPKLMQKGAAALQRLEDALAQSPFLCSEGFSIADIALVAYTRVAGEGGFDLAPFPAVRRWIAAVEERLGIPKAA